MDKSLQELIRKYQLGIDTSMIYSNIASAIREYNYLKETYWRLTKDPGIGFIPRVSSMPGVVQYNHLFGEPDFEYWMSHSDSHDNKNSLYDYYALVLIIEECLYIDIDTDIAKVSRLKEMLSDQDLGRICKLMLGKHPQDLVRETSYRYKDEVRAFVNEHKLLPYMRDENPN